MANNSTLDELKDDIIRTMVDATHSAYESAQEKLLADFQVNPAHALRDKAINIFEVQQKMTLGINFRHMLHKAQEGHEEGSLYKDAMVVALQDMEEYLEQEVVNRAKWGTHNSTSEMANIAEGAVLSANAEVLKEVRSHLRRLKRAIQQTGA